MLSLILLATLLTADDWVFRWEPAEGVVLHIHIDHHDSAAFQWHSFRISGADGETLHSDGHAWFIKGIEMPVRGSTSDSVFLTEWSTGAHGATIVPYYWSGKQVKAGPEVAFQGETFTLADVTGDAWRELIVLAQVERPRTATVNWPFYAFAYAWRGDHFEYIGRAPAETLKRVLRGAFH